MSRNKGTFKFPSNYEVQISAPLDPRITVSDKSELISENTWPSDNGTLYVYKGLLVSVQNEKSVYMLIDKDKILNEDFSGWRRIDVSIDNSLSENSENPVQNKVIKEALDNKANKSDLSGYLKEIQDGSITKNKLTTDLYKELIKVYHPDDLGFWMNQPENSDIDYTYGSRTIAINYDLDNRRATLQAGETVYDVTSDIVSSAIIYKWIPIISLYDNSGPKEIVSGSFLCEEGKQGFGFIYDNKQYSVCINETEDGVSYEETINELVPEYSISKDVKEDGTEYQLTKGGKPIKDSESIFISKSTGTGASDSESLKISEDIPVSGGPLSAYLIAAGVETIQKDSNLQDLLVSLFCKEYWPKISSTDGSISGIDEINSFTITASPDSLVEPGDIIKFSATQGSVKGYSASNSKVEGLTYGYSMSDNDEKEGDTKSFSKTWSVSPVSSSYALVFSGGKSNASSTGENPQTINNYEIVAKIGSNTCTAKSSGSVIYKGTINEIPIYYGVSSLGNTSDKYKSRYIPSQTKNVTSSGETEVTKIITCVYPCYHNVLSGNLESDTNSKMDLSTSTSYSVSNVPSEEKSDNSFMFDFPASVSIKSVQIQPDPFKYNIYSNINGDEISSSVFNKNHGSFKQSIEILNVPGESGSVRFGIEYPACATLDYVQAFDELNGYVKYEQYKTESIKRNGDSYTRLTMTHAKAGGETKYKFYFKTPTYATNTQYNIIDTKKIINGTEYDYKRLVSTAESGWTNRVITFNKSLDN